MRVTELDNLATPFIRYETGDLGRLWPSETTCQCPCGRTLPRHAQDLGKLGVDATRAGFFLMLRGRRLRSSLPAEQLRLFPPGEHLTRGPWRTNVPPCAYR